jgi:hypothetical protein
VEAKKMASFLISMSAISPGRYYPGTVPMN